MKASSMSLNQATKAPARTRTENGRMLAAWAQLRLPARRAKTG